MKWKTIALAVLFAVALPPVLFAQGIGWKLVNARIRSEFPDVPRIQTAELTKLLKAQDEGRPLLLDVRTQDEYEVSHLAGGVRIEPGSEVASLPVAKDWPIVTYCSVGYRSAAFARKLRAAGYSNVSNLEGSIFRWANENRPLVNASGPTAKVHPYNAVWGRLVEKAHRAL